MTQQRRRLKQTTTLGERLARHADRLRAEAQAMPRQQRELAMKKIQQFDVAKSIDEWLALPGLQPPR